MEKKTDYIFGSRPIIEAIESGKEIEKILIQKGLRNELSNEMMALLGKRSIPYQYVPVQKLNRVTQKNHQGAIAFISAVTYQRTEDILPMVYERGEVPFILVLDGITDVRNFGALREAQSVLGCIVLLFL